MADWLGTYTVATYLRDYLSFKKGRAFMRSLNLRSETEWREYCRLGKRPSDEPRQRIGSDTTEMLTSGISAWRTTGASVFCRCICRAWRAPMQSLDNSRRLAPHRQSHDRGGSNQGDVVRGRGLSYSRRNCPDTARDGCGESGSPFRALSHTSDLKQA
jgi:hypothetical protein